LREGFVSDDTAPDYPASDERCIHGYELEYCHICWPEPTTPLTPTHGRALKGGELVEGEDNTR
jgi:hypothetical protein